MEYSVQSGGFTGRISAPTYREAAKAGILKCVDTGILLGETITVGEKIDQLRYFKTAVLIRALQKEGHDISATDFGLTEEKE